MRAVRYSSLYTTLIDHSNIELSIGLVITCTASVSKVARRILDKRFPFLLSESTHREELNMAVQALDKPRRKHFPGGLSELDSMKTFGTTIDIERRNSSSIEALNASVSHRTVDLFDAPDV